MHTDMQISKVVLSAAFCSKKDWKDKPHFFFSLVIISKGFFSSIYYPSIFMSGLLYKKQFLIVKVIFLKLPTTTTKNVIQFYILFALSSYFTNKNRGLQPPSPASKDKNTIAKLRSQMPFTYKYLHSDNVNNILLSIFFKFVQQKKYHIARKSIQISFLSMTA